MSYSNIPSRLLLASLLFLVTACGGGSGTSTDGGGTTPGAGGTSSTATITGTPSRILNEEESYSFTVDVTGFSTSSLVYSIENKPAWASFDSTTGELSGTPSYEDAGTYSDIKISVSDGTHNETLNAFEISVVNSNRAPVLTSAKVFTVNESNGISTVIEISDADNDMVTVSFNGLPDWLEYFPEYNLLEGSPIERDLDDLSIEIVIDDGTVSTRETMHLTFILDDATWFQGKTIDHITSSDDGLLYLSVDSEKLVTFDPTLNAVIDIANISGIESLLYHNAHQQLYFFDSVSDQLKAHSSSFSVSDSSIECISGLTEADDYLIALDCGLAQDAYYAIDADGTVTGVAVDYNDTSTVNIWDPVEKRLYHLDSNSPSRNIFYRTLNDEGYFTSYNYSDYFYDDTLQGPIAISPDGSTLVLASGATFDADTLVKTGEVPNSFDNIIWLADDSLLLFTNGTSTTQVKRLSSTYELLESNTYTGNFLFADSNHDEVLLVTQSSSGLNSYPIVPSNDIDNDGVENTEDSFPTDSAASIDNDFDGYPDSWNSGFSGADSTTGLTIDYFPLDGACWLSSHAESGNSLACDYTATMPTFEPSEVLNDDNGNIFLLNNDTNTVYRWIEASQSYGNPIYLNTNNTILDLKYSSSHDRLYVLYENVGVYYVDLVSLTAEQSFLTSGNLTGIAVAGNYLVVADSYNSYISTYQKDGMQIDTGYSYDSTLEGFIYDETNAQAYYALSSSVLISQPITLLGFINYDYWNGYDYIVYSPLRLSADASSLLSASGHSFNTADLDDTAQVLPESAIDLQYFHNEIVTINSGTVADSTALSFYNVNGFSLVGDIEISGAPVALLADNAQAQLVTYDSETGIDITSYDLGDFDDDGLSNYVEVSLLASNPLLADSDADGMPDMYELENGLLINTNDSLADADTDGLTNVDEYLNNTGINNSDSDNDGLTDGDEVHIYFTSATDRDTDADGMPDDWELAYSFDPTSAADASTDTDADGYNNAQEYFLGSDPSNVNDTPEIKAWNSYQGNADNAGFVAVEIEASDLSLRWIRTIDDLSSTNSTPVASQGKVLTTYVNDDNDRIAAALSAVDGSVTWTVNYGYINSINSPSFNNDYMYFQTGGHDDSYLYALNIHDGSEYFSSSYNNQWYSYQAPTIFDNDVYMAGGSYGGAYKFDGELGTELWFNDLEQCSGWTPAVDENNVYYYDGAFQIADKSSGQVVNKSTTESYSSDCRTPVLGVNNAVVITDYGLYAFDKNTADVLWTIEPESYYTDFSGTPAAALGKIYTNKEGVLTVYDEFSGEELWSWQPASNNYLDNNIALSMNLVFVSDDYNTYAIDLATQTQIWSYPVSGNLSLSLEGALFIQSDDGIVVAINIAGDTDADGLDDWWEELYGLDVNDASDAVLNDDSDALTNLEEFTNGTNPLNADSDEDGLSDSDEVNTYLSNPNDSDTDADGMPDAWEVTHGFDLVNAADALLDADNDTVSNLDEYQLTTDPNDELSLPSIISSAAYSFEDLAIPQGWVVDQTLNSAWGVASVASSDGDYALLSASNAAISFSGYFAGNSLTLDAKNDCGYYDIDVYIDGELVESLDLSTDWQSFSVLVPNGLHEVRFESENCSNNYLDNIVLAPLDSLFDTDSYIVTTNTSQLLNFYNIDGELIKQVNIPVVSNTVDVRDLVVLDDGRVAVFNGTYSPSLSIYNPAKHSWQHLSDSDWGVQSYDAYGGIAAIGTMVYVTNMDTSYNDSAGIIQIDLTSNTFTYIDGENYVDLTIGLDGYLYAITDSVIDKYNLNTLTIEESFAVSSARSIAVDENSNMYIAEAYQNISRYNAFGVYEKTISTGDIETSSYVGNYPQDINVNGFGELFITNRDRQIILTDSTLDSISFYLDSNDSKAEFLSVMPFIDNDDDGMPKWWEDKYGLSDDDASDASTDLDDDELNNLDEYLAKLDPSKADSDDDGLSDYEEVTTYFTNPLRADTDKDGLDDALEINTHYTDPLDADSDDDGFSDGDEVNYYLTEPDNAASVPAIDLIDFNAGIVPSTLTSGAESNADWYIDNSTLRSGNINDYEASSVVYSKTFTAGTLTFDALLSSEMYADILIVYLDDQQVFSIYEQQTASYSIELTAGEHSITFSYAKDGSVSSGTDSAWIDNLLFTPSN